MQSCCADGVPRAMVRVTRQVPRKRDEHVTARERHHEHSIIDARSHTLDGGAEHGREPRHIHVGSVACANDTPISPDKQPIVIDLKPRRRTVDSWRNRTWKQLEHQKKATTSWIPTGLGQATSDELAEKDLGKLIASKFLTSRHDSAVQSIVRDPLRSPAPRDLLGVLPIQDGPDARSNRRRRVLECVRCVGPGRGRRCSSTLNTEWALNSAGRGGAPELLFSAENTAYCASGRPIWMPAICDDIRRLTSGQAADAGATELPTRSRSENDRSRSHDIFHPHFPRPCRHLHRRAITQPIQTRAAALKLLLSHKVHG